MKVLIFFTLCAEIYALSAPSEWRRLMKNVDKGIDLSEDYVKVDTNKKVADVVRELLKPHLDIDVDSNSSVCSCQKNTCGCCLHLEWDRVNLNDTVCANFSYLPADYGISLTLSVDGNVIYNKTVSARNPPAMCAGIPHLKKYASLCIRFGNLDFSNKTFSGCVYVLAYLEGFKIEEQKLGCFKFPTVSTDDVTMDTTNILDYGPHGIVEDELNVGNNALEETDNTLRFKPKN